MHQNRQKKSLFFTDFHKSYLCKEKFDIKNYNARCHTMVEVVVIDMEIKVPKEVDLIQCLKISGLRGGN
jgi:hypothetical protein